jgi:hypothetical protein
VIGNTEITGNGMEARESTNNNHTSNTKIIFAEIRRFDDNQNVIIVGLYLGPNKWPYMCICRQDAEEIIWTEDR